LAKTTERASRRKVKFDRFRNLYRKNASNPTAGQENPLPYTPIESADIDKNTNRFTSATGTTYNDAGQVIADSKFRAMSFGYDANGRMVKAAKANVPDALSVYDALGNRVATKFNDLWQFVIYDAFGKLIAEYGGMNPTDEGGVKYVLSDWQGSVRASVSNSGYVKSRTDYQAFGEEIQTGVGLRTSAKGFGGGINTRQGYGLTEKDDSTGLNHTWFRKNENRAGRWTSPDPYNGSASLGNPQSFNRYSYVENQPTNFVDPSGLVRILCTSVCELDDNRRPYNCQTSCTFDWSDSEFPDGDTGRRLPWDGGGGGGGGNDTTAIGPVNPLACLAAATFLALFFNCIKGKNPGINCYSLYKTFLFWYSVCTGTLPDDPGSPEKPGLPEKPGPKKPGPKPKPKFNGATRTNSRATVANRVKSSSPRRGSRRRSAPIGIGGLGGVRGFGAVGGSQFEGFGGDPDLGGGGAGGSFDDPE
jgi:RHS repeat-associated protein